MASRCARLVMLGKCKLLLPAEDLDEEDRRPTQRRRVDPDASDMLTEDGDEARPAGLLHRTPVHSRWLACA